MPIPDDTTPPEGTPIPSERETEPDLGSLRDCPDCGGMKRYLHIDDVGHGTVKRCTTCDDHGKVTQEEYAAWHAGRRSKK